MEVSGKASPLPFRFEGQAGEYFRIWIVNVMLTLLTLGVYSAWAKVRTNKYFYRNTFLGRESFDYHALPMQILRGRVILAAGLGVYLLAGYYDPRAELAVVLLIMLVSPLLVQRALRFRLRNTSYRGIRFAFAGSVWESYRVFLLGFFVSVITGGLALPWFIWLRSKYTLDNARFGKSNFRMDTPAKRFFGIYYGAVAVIMLAGVIMAVAMPALMPDKMPVDGQLDPKVFIWMQLIIMLILIPAYLLAWAITTAGSFNAIFNQTNIAQHGFESRLAVGSLSWILFSNIVAVVLSLGLLMPWARIRMARYRFACLQLLPVGDVEGFVADESREVSAAGEEIGDYLDLDLGF